MGNKIKFVVVPEIDRMKRCTTMFPRDSSGLHGCVAGSHIKQYLYLYTIGPVVEEKYELHFVFPTYRQVKSVKQVKTMTTLEFMFAGTHSKVR